MPAVEVFQASFFARCSCVEAVIRLPATREYESGDIVDNPLTPSMPRSGGRRGGLGGGGGERGNVCQRRSSFIFPFQHVCFFCLSFADHKDSPVCLANQSALSVAWLSRAVQLSVAWSVGVATGHRAFLRHVVAGTRP